MKSLAPPERHDSVMRLTPHRHTSDLQSSGRRRSPARARGHLWMETWEANRSSRRAARRWAGWAACRPRKGRAAVDRDRVMDSGRDALGVQRVSELLATLVAGPVRHRSQPLVRRDPEVGDRPPDDLLERWRRHGAAVDRALGLIDCHQPKQARALGGNHADKRGHELGV